MSTALTTSNERKALMMLGDEQVAVRIDDAGFLKRVLRKVRLQYGPELYCAKMNPGPTEKVMPYQPGYMRLVAAAGGQLLCPPQVKDPETGKARPNPFVETYADTGIIRRVTATALCAVRNASTGEIVASVQTIVVDTEHILRQALLKLAEREDCVQILSDVDVAEQREGGRLKGWVVLPLTPPFAYIVANMKMASVRDAWQTFQNQSATARQRACSKAERLAADHNPVTRQVWEYGELTFPIDKDGNAIGAPYKEVSVVAWVEHRGDDHMSRMLETLAEQGKATGIDTVLVGAEVIDVGEDDPDDDEVERPLLTQAVDVTPAPVRQPEPVRVETPEPPAARAATPPAAAPTGAGAQRSPELDRMLSRVKELEAGLTREAVDGARDRCGIADPAAVTDSGLLRGYQREITALANGGR